MAARWPGTALLSSKAPRRVVFLFTLSLSITYLFYSLLTCYSSFPLQEAGGFLQPDPLSSSLQGAWRAGGPGEKRDGSAMGFGALDRHSGERTSDPDISRTDLFIRLDISSLDRLNALGSSPRDRFSSTSGSFKKDHGSIAEISKTEQFDSMRISMLDQIGTSVRLKGAQSSNPDSSKIDRFGTLERAPTERLSALDSSLYSSTRVRFSTTDSAKKERFSTTDSAMAEGVGSVQSVSSGRFSTSDSATGERHRTGENAPGSESSTLGSSERTAQQDFSTEESSLRDSERSSVTPGHEGVHSKQGSIFPEERMRSPDSQETPPREWVTDPDKIKQPPMSSYEGTFRHSDTDFSLHHRDSVVTGSHYHRDDAASSPSGLPTWGRSPLAVTPMVPDLESERQESSTTDEELGHRASPVNSTPEYGEQKLPQAIIIGVKKGGTRALLEALRVHPDVRAVRVEPHFFDRNYEKGLEWYRSLMPNTLDGQITMEKTPSYFVTNEAPRRIHAMAKDVKLIVVVRNPITRAISDYTQTLSKKPEIPTFEVLAFKNRTLGLIDASWSALRIGIYALHLESWLRYFPLSQILFVSGERLIDDPAGELDKVQDFLGLKRIVTDKHFYFNKTKGFPCLKKPEDSSAPRCLGKSKGRTHPKIEPEVIHRLHKFYKPFNAMFYQMTGQDFEWEREDLDK